MLTLNLSKLNGFIPEDYLVSRQEKLAQQRRQTLSAQ